MNIPTDIKPVTYLKSKAADLLKQINKNHLSDLPAPQQRTRQAGKSDRAYRCLITAIKIL